MACGESIAPTPTIFPLKSEMELISESDLTTMTEVKFWSVSRMATASALRPALRANRSARTQASGEFHAI